MGWGEVRKTPFNCLAKPCRANDSPVWLLNWLNHHYHTISHILSLLKENSKMVASATWTICTNPRFVCCFCWPSPASASGASAGRRNLEVIAWQGGADVISFSAVLRSLEKAGQGRADHVAANRMGRWWKMINHLVGGLEHDFYFP